MRTMSFGRLWHLSVLIAVTLIVAGSPLGTAAWAQEDQEVEAAGWISAEPAEKKSVEQMLADDEEVAIAGLGVIVDEVPSARPTIDMEKYLEAKSTTGQAGASSAEVAMRSAQLEPLSPPNLITSFEGLNQSQSGNLRPPDTHIAVGKGWYLEIVNSRLAAYQTSNGAQVFSVSLASFFNYFTETIFDPRVMYDKVYDQWIVTAEAFAESSSVQYHFIAVSKIYNPTRNWYIYRIDVNPTTDPNYFWDFPQVGYDQDSVIVTANVFNPGYAGASMFAVAKALLYNGHAWGVPRYDGLQGTLAPPVVLDQNIDTYLLAAPPYSSPGGTTMYKYRLRGSAYPGSQQLFLSNITNPVQYFIPPNARQLGTTATLDTLDCRFGNWSTQLGDSIWNTHSISFGSGSWAWAYWYEIDTTTNAVVQYGNMGAQGNSDDWMPHIAVNYLGDIFAVWSQSDNTAYYPRICIRGKEAPDATTYLGSCTVVRQSPTFYTQGRWGDYQCVDRFSGLDWGNQKTAFAVGEYVTGNTFWNSRVAKIRFP